MHLDLVRALYWTGAAALGFVTAALVFDRDPRTPRDLAPILRAGAWALFGITALWLLGRFLPASLAGLWPDWYTTGGIWTNLAAMCLVSFLYLALGILGGRRG